MDRREKSDMLEARRRFLAACGRYAAITPPAMALLLSSTRQHYANAGSHTASGLQGNNGFGNGGGDGTPGRSGSNPSPQAPSKSADLNR